MNSFQFRLKDHELHLTNNSSNGATGDLFEVIKEKDGVEMTPE
jgi:hypothetical protein